MYEPKHLPPITRAVFARRMALHATGTGALLLISLVIGMAGYMGFENLAPVDAFLNTAMPLGGTGPVDLPKTLAGKWFAGAFALYAGLVFIVTAAVPSPPLLRRVLHRFHWDEKD